MASGVGYVQIQTEPSLRQSGGPEPCRIFEELPEATIVSVSRPDAADISPLLLTYTIQLRYKQFKWQLVKKASQVFYLHFKLKKRAFIEEMQERQEQCILHEILSNNEEYIEESVEKRVLLALLMLKVKEWLQNIGIGELTPSMQDDDETDGEAVHLHHQDESAKDRDVPSSAALPIIRPALGRLQAISGRAKIAMQGYLNHFLGNISIVNSPEVCKFLEVSKLSFSPEYGSKLKEEYVRVMHLPKIPKDDDGGSRRCCMSDCFSCCNDNLQKVWAVLKPGFLALLADPFDVQPLDIIVFDVLPPSDGKGDGHLSLAKEIKERNPLRHSFKVTCGNRSIELRVKSSRKVADWLAAINDAGLRTLERWCQHHRYDSFAPPRGLIEDGSQAQWFVDGQAAFEAIASSIKNAKSEIFFCGWWLCPELYLQRPFHTQASSRLDNLLEEKAKQGVQVYILLYKEVALALKINSFYSKRKLLCIHENVRVLRYPDHFSAGVYLWSHHEKIVIIDHQICFIGGLDLCFGRYDTPEHKVGDSPPLIWPGKDYYNPRESEPNSWEDTMKDELDRGKYPRMPWHDVHCALWGPPCRDIARHFVERWNYAKRNKAPNQQAIPLLIPRHHMVIPHYMGRSLDDTAIERGDSFSLSSQDIPLLLPQESGGLNISVRESKLNRLSSFSHLHDQSNRVSSSLAFSLPKAKIDPSDIAMKGLSGVNYHDKMSLDRVSHVDTQSTATEWWKTPEHADESRQVGPRASCRCQVIRSVSQWSAGTRKNEESIHNAYCSLIEKAEHFIYIENQFFISGLSGDDIIRNRVSEALYRRVIRAYEDNKLFRVIIVIPLLPGFQGGLDDSGAASVRAIMHWQYRTICRGQNSILHNLFQLLGPRIQDYISFYGLRAYGRLSDNGPMATNQVYVHSKIMIVDDCTCLIGSANINDRSLLGSRDSEIGVIIEDGELIGSYMDGKPWKAGKFSLTLRLSLWSEHLGLRAGEVNRIMDPVVESTYKDIWMATAKTNTTIYQDVFSCVPNDEIHTRFAFRQSVASWKEKNGHTTIDLGVAPKKVEALERLASVKGHLVSFPLEFMSLENLRPAFIESYDAEIMVLFPSFVNGLARTMSFKKEKNCEKDDGRKAVKELAKEAKKNESLLTSSGVVKSTKSNSFVSMFTNKGQKGVNQDRFIVWEEFGCEEDMMLCGIFDGHGPWGHLIAKRVRKLVPILLLQNWQENVGAKSLDQDFKMEEDRNMNAFHIWKQSYLKTYAAVDQDLKLHTKIDSFQSGTTALTIIKQGENLIIANIGDSRAILATTSDDGKITSLQLTTDLKPNLPKEAERIKQCKGSVFCLKDEPGVYRVWRPNGNTPGLAISRAFGDYCLKDFGIISVPDVIHTKLTTKDQFLILATDGVWDVISNQEAVRIVCSTPHKEKAAKRVVKYAIHEWKRKRSNIAMDDMSAICFFFHSSTLTH